MRQIGRNPTQAVRGTETRFRQKARTPGIYWVEIPLKPFAALKPRTMLMKARVRGRVEIPLKPFAALKPRGLGNPGLEDSDVQLTGVEIPLKPFAALKPVRAPGTLVPMPA